MPAAPVYTSLDCARRMPDTSFDVIDRWAVLVYGASPALASPFLVVAVSVCTSEAESTTPLLASMVFVVDLQSVSERTSERAHWPRQIYPIENSIVAFQFEAHMVLAPHASVEVAVAVGAVSPVEAGAAFDVGIDEAAEELVTIAVPWAAEIVQTVHSKTTFLAATLVERQLALEAASRLVP